MPNFTKKRRNRRHSNCFQGASVTSRLYSYCFLLVAPHKSGTTKALLGPWLKDIEVYLTLLILKITWMQDKWYQVNKLKDQYFDTTLIFTSFSYFCCSDRSNSPSWCMGCYWINIWKPNGAVKYGQSRETYNLGTQDKDKQNKNTQRNMCWTTLYANTHK